MGLQDIFWWGIDQESHLTVYQLALPRLMADRVARAFRASRGVSCFDAKGGGYSVGVANRRPILKRSLDQRE
jgi:hypothetical protein